MKAQLSCGNKWSEIAKELQGRSENMVKNRFNMLYKKHREDSKKSVMQDVSEALQAVSEIKVADTEWITRLISEKQRQIEGMAQYKYHMSSKECKISGED